jgi:hypothetical protein
MTGSNGSPCVFAKRALENAEAASVFLMPEIGILID